MKRFLLLPLFATSLAMAASYNVRDFGATGDGTTKDTKAFQKALDTCAVNGGGEVVVPAGKYLIGSIQLGTHTTLRFESPDTLLVGSPDLDDYPIIDVRWEGRTLPGHRALIYATNVEHIGIVGPGTIEGNAATAASNRPPRGTLIIEPINCRDIHWEGFTVRQPGNNWATHPTYCTDVVIKNVNISGRRDGIDVDSCRNVLIGGCTIESGDDCISLKSGRGMDGARLGRPTEDVTIRDCTLTGGRFACIGIGSETSGGVRNIRIERCRMKAYTHTIYIKTRIGRAGVNENIFGDDLEILGGDFLRINLVKGGNTSTADDPVEGLVGYPEARNFVFNNIKMNGGKALIVGTEVSAKKPLRGLTITNVTGTHTGITLANMTDVVLRNVVPGVAPAAPSAPTAAGQPAPGPVFGIVNVTGTGLEGATPIPAPVDPPVGNAAGHGAQTRAAGQSERFPLWNGQDLAGWKIFLGDDTVDRAKVWSVTDGVLRLDTKASGYAKTEKTFSNYHLHVEWRWPKGAAANSNSGVLVHLHGDDKVWPLCFECQLKTGNAGQVVGMGLDIPAAPLENNRKRAPKFAATSEKPHGEWNTYEIFCRDDTIEVFVNGTRQNFVEKLPAREGAIALQMEGFPIEFRNVWLEPL
jgi:hypothetical protein